MQRRQWLTCCAGAVLATGVSSAQADDFVDFTPERYKEALTSGQPFMVGFLSTW